MNYEYELMVYIGRFQPLHSGHVQTIQNALKQARRLVILVGSHNAPSTARNPWTSEERQDMIRSALSEEEYGRCLVAGLEDCTYNDEKWTRRIREIVQGFRAIYASGRDAKIGITGFDKDSSSYYLHMFPEWELVENPDIVKISSTQVRHAYFDHGTVLTDVLPEATCRFLIDFKRKAHYQYLKEEHDYCKECKRVTQGDAKFPVIITTVDNVVCAGGNWVLLVRRGGQPGKGLWAMPGGHLNVDETLLSAAKRELFEETEGEIPKDFELVSQHTFDDPNRSNRGRCITTAFNWKCSHAFDINSEGADDACEAKWFTIYELQNMRSQIHEDHYHIIDYFLDLKLV